MSVLALGDALSTQKCGDTGQNAVTHFTEKMCASLNMDACAYVHVGCRCVGVCAHVDTPVHGWT